MAFSHKGSLCDSLSSERSDSRKRNEPGSLYFQRSSTSILLPSLFIALAFGFLLVTASPNDGADCGASTRVYQLSSGL